MSIKLNAGQNNTILNAIGWYVSESLHKPLYTISGLAGTGKSTVVEFLTDALGLMKSEVLYVALTGKATSVLRMKGHLANTIHRTFFNVRAVKSKVYFNPKAHIPGNIKLIVIDEFGMVGDSITNVILNHNIPTIGLGDHGQLPPLFEKNTYMTETKLDAFLTEVMRFDDASGIGYLSMEARGGRQLVPGTYGRSRVITSKNEMKDFTQYDVTLCWTNKTRRFLNQRIRSELGLTSRYPTKGERIYFLANRYDYEISYMGIVLYLVNGLECDVLEDAVIVDKDTLRIHAKPTFIPDTSIYFDVLVSRAVFDGYYEPAPDTKKLMEMDRENDGDMIFCDYAWAMSVHASQGSEWGNVLIIDEMPQHRPEYWRHLYTGITRAKLSVDVLLNQ